MDLKVALALTALCLAACAPARIAPEPAASAQQQAFLMPGVYDFPLYEGTSVPQTCRWVQPPQDPERSTCVIFAQGVGFSAQMPYLTAITESGWELISGDDDSFWFNRPIPNTDCADRFYFSGGFDATPEEIAASRAAGRFGDIKGLFFFLMKAEPVCGRARYEAAEDERAW